MDGTCRRHGRERSPGPWKSFMGLMLVDTLPPGHGFLFRSRPARGIHTHYMRFPINLVFIDEMDRVTNFHEDMMPRRIDLTTAPAVIELNAGSVKVADQRPGDRLIF